MVSVSSLNPFASINLGSSWGTFGAIGLVIVIAVVILVLIGFLVYFFIVNKQYWIKIHLYRLVGNVPTRIAIHCAKEVPFGMAGDKLWRVAPNSVWTKAFKIIKWLPIGKIQSAPNEFWYYIREDGEWINFRLADLDKVSKESGVKFVVEDARLSRLAIERLLEQRLMDKTFWEKWSGVIMTFILFLVLAVAVVIIFFMWGKLIDKMTPLIEQLTNALKEVTTRCSSGGGASGLIPAE